MCDKSSDLFDHLELMGCLSYGGTFTRSMVLDAMDVEIILEGTREDFQEMDLAELEAVGYIRNVLINQGKWVVRKGETYRVLMPSENEGQIRAFSQRGDRAYLKATKLAKSTPPEFFTGVDTTMHRAAAKRKAAAHNIELNEQLSA